MKRNLLLTLLVILVTALQAGEVSQQQALEKARAFMQNHQTAGKGAMRRAPLHIDMQGTETGHQLLYAFNVEGGGYNLAGQRVAQPTKGLYIVNGRKVVMK